MFHKEKWCNGKAYHTMGSLSSMHDNSSNRISSFKLLCSCTINYFWLTQQSMHTVNTCLLLNKWKRNACTWTALLRKQLFSPGAFLSPLAVLEKDWLVWRSQVSYQCAGAFPPGRLVSVLSIAYDVTYVAIMSKTDLSPWLNRILKTE